ncbi:MULTISPECIES: hypothetical protein [Pseudoalteromonas]|uniref:Uncharacterized protein n=1 Tax=Pseudoalteromonas amylolytica TaxID=1859457 RepID=A0A1S1MR62_9GAMM|nr:MULTISPECIES: hypothetical protein [Pseudoalteromonas]OHU86989.1 hypothetical protein BFC16_13055 [Pseudoalteromonas sp. JW3]OHU88302.1 hypothetical protein BET10_19705 [Pseudoalteromonas amylolytica]
MIKKNHVALAVSLVILGSIIATTQFIGTEDTAAKKTPTNYATTASGEHSNAEQTTSLAVIHSKEALSNSNTHASAFDSSVLDAAKKDVTSYIEFNQYADRAQRKTALFERWALDSKMHKLQQDILVQAGLAESVFASNQAHARLLAIDYLGYLSKNGQRDAIERTISGLSKRINNEQWSKGIEHDYVDLMFKYTDSLTQDELMSNFEEIIAFSGYSKKSHDLFTTGLSLSETVLLLPDNKMEELKTRLNLVKEQL